jgi:hypothetical protein
MFAAWEEPFTSWKFSFVCRRFLFYSTIPLPALFLSYALLPCTLCLYWWRCVAFDRLYGLSLSSLVTEHFVRVLTFTREKRAAGKSAALALVSPKRTYCLRAGIYLVAFLLDVSHIISAWNGQAMRAGCWLGVPQKRMAASVN